MEKMTNKQALENAIKYIDNELEHLTIGEDVAIANETRDKLTTMLKALDRKNVAKKQTPKQAENECHKQKILDLLVGSNGMKCGEIGAAIDISGNQASALLSQLVKAEVVERFKGEKGATLFRLREVEKEGEGE